MNRSKIKRPHPVHFGIAAEIKKEDIVLKQVKIEYELNKDENS